MRMSNSRDFLFKTTTSSKIVKDAIKRYELLIFHRSDIEHENCNSQTAIISTVLIYILNESEALNLDTNYRYTLTISIETTDATIVANSPFGAMYVLSVLLFVQYYKIIRNTFKKGHLKVDFVINA